MSSNKLNLIALKLCESPKGILAADESTNTIKRFDSINVESSFDNREEYTGSYLKLQILINSLVG